MLRSSPRARAGLSMLAASIAPSPLPAPTRVCISSINNMISPSACVTSLTMAFSLSSNSPLYFAPATSAPMSSENICLSFKFSGTSPRTILWARPSAIAVFPVPGSPISIGLFLVRLDRICNTRLISSSRPITGSSLPERARSFRFMAYFDNALYVSSALWSLALRPLRSSSMADDSSCSVSPASFNICEAGLFTEKRASSSASTATYWSPCFFAMSRAFCSTSFDVRLRYGSPPCTFGSEATARSTDAVTDCRLAPTFWNMN